MNKLTYVLTALAAILVTTIVVGNISSAQMFGRFHQNNNHESCLCTPEMHEAMEKAMENNDYEAWKKLREEAPNHRQGIAEMVTKENFSAFAKSWKLREEGKFTEARKIMEDNGLLGRFLGRRNGQGRHRGRGFMLGEHRGNRGECANTDVCPMENLLGK